MSRLLPSSEEPGMITWRLRGRQNKTKPKHAQQSIQYTARPLGRNYRIITRAAGVILLVLISRCRPLPLLVNRNLLAGGDSCCCNCIRVLREVCLNGVVNPPICALRGRPFLFPENHQFLRSVSFDDSWSVSTLVREIKSPPSSVLGVPFTTTSSFSSEARGRSCGLFFPSRCPLITSSVCTVLGEVVESGRL